MATRSTVSYLPWLALAGFALIRLMYIPFVNLVPDEAYYWDWSRYLATGYFDHPPMIAWMTWLSTRIFGNSLLAIRLVPWVGSIGCIAAMLILARRYLVNPVSSVMLIVFFFAAVLCSVGTLLLTPDIPLMLFWSFALVAAYDAYFSNCWSAWISLGVFCGLGLLSKYTFVLFGVSSLVFLLASKKHRSMLLNPKLYVALIISGLVFLPNVIWNSRHAWVSYLFQLSHGLKGARWPRFDRFGDYVGGQIGIVTPLLFVVLIIAVVVAIRRMRKDPSFLFLLSYFLVPFAFFAWTSLSKRVEPNWPAPAYAAGFVLAAWLYERAVSEHKKGLVTFIKIAAGFGCVASVLIMVHIVTPILPLPVKKDPTAALRGWNAAGRAIGKILDRVNPQHIYQLCGNRYQETAMMAFYVPGQPKTLSLDLGSRTNHYALLPDHDKRLSDTLIFVDELCAGTLHPSMANGFAWFALLDSVLLVKSPHDSAHLGVFIGMLKRKE